MKEHGILFKADMVRAILDGRKTQTRRLVKARVARIVEEVFNVNGRWVWDTLDFDLRALPQHGPVGRRLWVRETWCNIAGPMPDDAPRADGVCYRADNPGGDIRWTPAIHMPRWASRITLEVTGIRCERLQDITLGDVVAEGLATSIYDFKPAQKGIDAYRDLWESINGPGSWDANPWVWVYEFKRIEQ